MFDDPPAAGAVITANYEVLYIPRTATISLTCFRFTGFRVYIETHKRHQIRSASNPGDISLKLALPETGEVGANRPQPLCMFQHQNPEV